MLLLGLAAAPAQASWFGPPCAGPQLIPVDDHEVFLHVRRHEADPGDDDSLRVLKDGRLQARPQTLLDWGVAAAGGKAQPDGEGGWWQTLDDVGGLEYRYDSCTQELLLDLSHTRRATNVLVANVRETPEPQPASVPGGYANVDVQAVSGDNASLSGLLELGAFAGSGHGIASMLANADHALRLETSWTIDQPAKLRQWVIGDSIAREAPGRRPLRFGGLSWGTEFRLQPDVVTFPLPDLRGDAVLPSTVDVYVDGVLRQREDVPPGPFELRNVPVLSGGGEMRAVVRDLLGREQTLSQPFYVSPGLLRVGLSDYRLEAGWLRQNYGAVSEDYGPAFAAAAYRLGISNAFTLSAGADASEHRQALGAGLFTELGRLFSASLELAGSHAQAGPGGQTRLGLQHNGSGFSAALDLRAASKDYSALGETEPASRYAISAYAGLPLGSGDSLAFTGVAESRRQEGRLQLYSLNYSTRLSADWLAGAQATRTLNGGNDDWIGGLSITWLLGRGNAGLTAQRSDGSLLARASWQQPSEHALGMGYQVDVEHYGRDEGDSIQRGVAQLRWAQERGVLSAAVDVGPDDTALRYGLQTGIAFLGKEFFATRPVQGSFAVVEAGDAEGVRIYRDHQLAGYTNAEGRALIPDLRAYESNRIGLELNDLPIEQRADAEELTVVPYARSGASVRFPVSAAEDQRALRLQLADGSWLPAGARVAATGRGKVLTGIGGRVLLQDVAPGAKLEAQWRGGRCRAQLQPRRANDDDEEIVLCGAY